MVTEFSVLNSEDKKLQIYNYSLKIGCLSKEYYTKKFLKEIEDIEELDITKISPNIFDQTLDSSIPDLECSNTVNTENYTFLNLKKIKIGTRWGVYYIVIGKHVPNNLLNLNHLVCVDARGTICIQCEKKCGVEYRPILEYMPEVK